MLTTMLSTKELVALKMLNEIAPCHGLDLVEHSQGYFAKGSVYLTLSRLEDRKLIQSAPSPNPAIKGSCRRSYMLTHAGVTEVQGWSSEVHRRINSAVLFSEVRSAWTIWLAKVAVAISVAGCIYLAIAASHRAIKAERAKAAREMLHLGDYVEVAKPGHGNEFYRGARGTLVEYSGVYVTVEFDLEVKSLNKPRAKFYPTELWKIRRLDVGSEEERPRDRPDQRSLVE